MIRKEKEEEEKEDRYRSRKRRMTLRGGRKKHIYMLNTFSRVFLESVLGRLRRICVI